jgi:hypothetical protein
MRLDPRDIALIADATAARLLTQTVSANRLLDAASVAERFGVSRDWVYLHADQLGGKKLGDGRNAPWRFDPAKVADGLSAGRDSRKSTPADHAPRQRSRRRTTSGAPLLPIRALNERPKRDAEQV